MSNPSLFEELKRRRVFRATAAYVVVAIGVAEAANNFFPALELPPWTVRFVVVLALLGLPVTIALSWAFDIRPDGAPKTSSPPTPSPRHAWTASRIAVVGAVAIIALAGAAMLFTWRPPGTDVAPNRVAVLPFENGTGDASLDDLGDVAADWITDGLSSVSGVEVIPTVTVAEALSESGPDADPIAAVTRSTGAGLVVTGSYVIRGDSIEVRAQLVGMPEGRVVGSVGPARTGRSSPTTAFDSVRTQIMGRIAARLDTYGELAGMGRPNSYEAYRLYLAGKERFWALRYGEGTEMFDRALGADSDFLAPRVWIAFGLYETGQFARMDSVLRLAEVYRPGASPNERLLLDWLQAHLRADRGASYRLARELFRRVPTSHYRFLAALAAQGDNRPREAVELYEALPERGILRERPVFYNNLDGALHHIGEYEQELHVARQARSRFPGVARPVFAEARALAALHRTAEAQTVLHELTTLPDATDSRWLQVQGGLELRHHGDGAAGEAQMHDALVWLLSHDSLSHRYAVARTRLWLGEPAAALPHFRALVEQDPGNVDYLGYLGLALAASGRTAEALEVDARLAQWSDPYARGNDLYWRAAMAAQLGEKDRAMALLEDAVSRGYRAASLQEDENLRPLWDYPPFQRLIEPKG